MIFYNGATGGLGRHLGPVLNQFAVANKALATRIENATDLSSELESDQPPGSSVALIHLAARVSVPRCEQDPTAARAINVDGARAYPREFVGWASRRGYLPTVVYVSTGHVYAPSEPGVPLTEDDEVEPRSVYARTKWEGELALWKLAAASNFRLIISRVFGLLAPGQPAHYVLPGLIGRVKGRNLNGIPGLSNVRDYLDARDVVDHLRRLVEWSSNQAVDSGVTVNICSGDALQIRTLLEIIITVACESDPLQREELLASVTEAPSRPTDVGWLVGSPHRLVGLTSRPPRSIDLETSVRDAISTF